MLILLKYYLILFEPLNIGNRDTLHHLGGVLAVDVRLQHVGHVEDRAVSSEMIILSLFGRVLWSSV